MKRICFFAMLCVFVSGSVFAGPIFDPSKQPKPPDLIPPTDAHPNSKPEKPVSGAPQKDIREYLSGAYYAIGKDKKPKQIIDNAQAEIQPDMATAEMLAQMAAPWVQHYNASFDSYQDAEPSVISIFRSPTLWTATVYTKLKMINGDLFGRNHFSTFYTTPSIYFQYSGNNGDLPLPPPYNCSGDPLLAANPYVNGIAPGRIYASGVVIYIPQQTE